MTRINWLGDWGTQFGLLAFGLKGQNVKEFTNPIQQLYQVYVRVNSLAETDPKVGVEAKNLFTRLEAKEDFLTSQWADIREVTIEALSKVYSRLGIRFDYYHGEAMYGNEEVCIIFVHGHKYKESQNTNILYNP